MNDSHTFYLNLFNNAIKINNAIKFVSVSRNKFFISLLRPYIIYILILNKKKKKHEIKEKLNISLIIIRTWQ